MISDREFLNVYVKPYPGIINPNLMVELPVVVTPSYFLLEDSSYLLLEDSYKLILES